MDAEGGLEIGGLRPRPGAGPLRCAFCHGEVPRGGVRCGACGAVHHRACLHEAPRCATCAVDLAAAADLPLRGRREVSPALVLAALAGAGLVAAVTLAGWRSAAAPIVAPLSARVQITPPGPVLRQRVISLRGTIAAGAGAHVRAGGGDAFADARGRFTLAGLALPEGPSVLRVEVAQGGETATVDLPLLVDSAPPLLTLLEPADLESATAASRLRVVVRVDDASPVDVRIGGQPAEALGDGRHAREVPLVRGPNRVDVVAVDQAGWRAAAALSVRRRPPRLTLEVLEPADGAIVGGSAACVRGRVASDGPLTGLRVTVGDATATVSSDGTFEAWVPNAEGRRAASVVAWTGEGRVQARCGWTGDLTPPRLEVLLPTDVSTPRAAVEVTCWAIDDGPWTEVRVVGAPGAVVRLEGGRPGVVSLPLGEGGGELTLLPVDAAGNEGAAVTLRALREPDGPAWLRALAAEARPPLPLPEGLCFGAAPGEYVNERDGSVLAWAGGVFMGKHEVTERQLAVQRMAAGRTAAPAHAASAVLPARRVSWEEARAYAAWAGLRLPTRAEWTRAALGDDGRPFPWGEAEPGPPRVNTPPARQGGQLVLGAGDHGRPEAVTARPAGASPVGCLHMIGNVAEWVADVDPARPALRLHMGGSFRAPVDRALGATFAPAGPDDAVGLRVCR